MRAMCHNEANLKKVPSHRTYYPQASSPNPQPCSEDLFKHISKLQVQTMNMDHLFQCPFSKEPLYVIANHVNQVSPQSL